MEQPTTDRKRVAKPAGERRQEILESAVRLFRERGFDETTVQDIAEGAEVATGTVYLHYRSKSHVLHAIHEEFHRGFEERFGAVGLGLLARQQRGETIGPRDTIDAMWDAAMAYVRDRRPLWEIHYRYPPRLGPEENRALDTAHARFMGDLFRAGVEGGFVFTDDPEMTGYLLAAVNGAVGQAATIGDPPDLDRVLAHAKELYARMLTPPAEEG